MIEEPAEMLSLRGVAKHSPSKWGQRGSASYGMLFCICSFTKRPREEL